MKIVSHGDNRFEIIEALIEIIAYTFMMYAIVAI